MRKKVDVIVPTMWKEPLFHERYVPLYLKDPHIENLIIVDNDPACRPVLPPQSLVVSYGKNIFVNPAWNEGNHRASSEIICLLNDDIFLPSEVTKHVSSLDWDDLGIIGTDVNYKGNRIQIQPRPVRKDLPLGSQVYGFGVCMFMLRKNFTPIPSLYKIWYGDDFLVQNANSVYTIGWPSMDVKMSKTVNCDDLAVSDRINLDVHNAHSYLFK